MKKVLATLILVGFLGLVALFMWLCVNVEYFAYVVFILILSGAAISCVGTLLFAFWKCIYDSLED